MCIIVVLSISVVGHLVTRLKSFLKNMSGIYNIYIYIYNYGYYIYPNTTRIRLDADI